MPINEQISLEAVGDVAVLWVNNPPVNALSRGVRDGLKAGFEKARADAAFKAIVLACRSKTFIAGADIKEFGKKSEGASLPEVMDAIENSEKPVVAAIFGTALGGGLETALCCHYRVAVPSAKLGLPEVKLGILPGAGGTQRLPRIFGAQRALDMITSGEPISAKDALDGGLVDALVREDALLEDAVAFARALVAEKKPLKKVRDRDDKISGDRGKPELFAAYKKQLSKKSRGFDAPLAIVDCVQAAVEKPFAEGLAVERERFQGLMRGLQAGAQRYYFFAEREAAKVPDVPKDTKIRDIKQVGILGAGTMGGGIAMCFANQGIKAHMVEVKQDALERGISTIRKNYERSVKSGRLKQEDVEKRMALISGSLSQDDFAPCDLVIEAVFESMPLKKEIFGNLDRICKPGAILASNTSGLDINEIASATKRPEDVIGMHFFSPANVMKLLENVRGTKTQHDVIATAMEVGKKIGKVPVLVGVCRGFVGNRMLYARREQANKLIMQGPMPWDVDRVLYDFGFPMGPFAMSDLAGLDIGWDAKNSKGETLRDRLCEMGRRGQKTGSGYYNYDAETREKSPEPKVAELIETFSKEKGFTRRAMSDEEILDRCMLPMVNEAAKILEEGIAIRGSDVDVVWVNGYGFPVYRGGPMRWADDVGLPKIVARLKELQATDKDDFWKPAALLEQLASEGKKISEWRKEGT
jgi:3-hydroxyacyl-CoA dehydrogenase